MPENKGVAAFDTYYLENLLKKDLPFWHDNAITAVRLFALFGSYRPTVEFFNYTIGLEPFATALCAVFVSIVYAAACSLPFEYVMIQLQKMQPDAEGKYPYTGFLDCADKTFKAGGVMKFYTGFPLYCARNAPRIMMECFVVNKLRDGRKVAGYIQAVVKLLMENLPIFLDRFCF